ncbi:MAG: hypothetical protein H8E15_07375, partial [Planctomycetes bacterium]|nr:hypothetical protein [Planctomycetota bacterium]
MFTILPKFLAVTVCLLLFPATTLAQNNGIDPPVDGNILEVTDQEVTFSDGYRTLLDIRYPTTSPNPGGWPMVLFVHSSGTSRTQVNGKAKSMAKRGYITVTYDVRGQGPGMALNNAQVHGRSNIGIRERIDMFETIEAVEALFPSVVDMDRIGV